MNLEDLYKLAGIQRSDTPAIEPKPVEQEVVEQPMDGRDNMKAMIALVTPEQLNQIVGDAPVEEEGFANSGDEYAGEPEEYKGKLGSPADLSLRRYLGANGVPVNVDETKVYEDHKVEDISEAWNAYKAKNDTVNEYYVDPKTRQVYTSKADARDGIGGNLKTGQRDYSKLTNPDRNPDTAVTSPGEAPPMTDPRRPPKMPDIDYIKPGSPKMPKVPDDMPYFKPDRPPMPDIDYSKPGSPRPSTFDGPYIPTDKNDDGKIDYKDLLPRLPKDSDEKDTTRPDWLTRLRMVGKNESNHPLEEEPNEGNEFSGALAQAKKDGKKEFKVGDKTYKVESEEAEVVEDENISMLRKLAGI